MFLLATINSFIKTCSTLKIKSIKGFNQYYDTNKKETNVAHQRRRANQYATKIHYFQLYFQTYILSLVQYQITGERHQVQIQLTQKTLEKFQDQLKKELIWNNNKKILAIPLEVKQT